MVVARVSPTICSDLFVVRAGFDKRDYAFGSQSVSHMHLQEAIDTGAGTPR
jgi:hypothetical protein